MPSIQLFGRKWNFASDDAPFPATLAALCHFALCWLTGVQLGAFLRDEHSPCSSQVYGAYLKLILAACLISLVLESWCTLESLRGTLFEDSKRTRVAPLIAALLCVLLGAIAINGWGTWVLYLPPAGCEPPSAGTTALIWVMWAGIAAALSLVLSPLNSLPSEHARNVRMCGQWQCTVCLCCQGRDARRLHGQQRQFERLAGLFHAFLRQADLTTSDVAVGIHLAAQLQHAERYQAISALVRDHTAASSRLLGAQGGETVQLLVDGLGYEEGSQPAATAAPRQLLTTSHSAALLSPVPCSPRSLSALYCMPGEPAQLAELEELSYYVRFAMAAYGPLYFVYAKLQPRRLLEAFGNWRYSSSLRQRRTQLPDTQRARSPTASVSSGFADSTPRPADPGRMRDLSFAAAICSVAGILRTSLRHVSGPSVMANSEPYFIALDHSNRTVVVSIRGTFSLDDAITDLMCLPAGVKAWSDGLAAGPAPCPFSAGRSAPVKDADFAGACGHQGAMNRAAALIRDLAQHRVLFALLGAGGTDDRGGGGGRGRWRGSVDEAEAVVTPEGAPGAACKRNGQPGRQPSGGLLDEGDPAEASPARPHVPCRGWRLLIIGHSLGAGIATFVGLHLRRYYHNLRVLAFGPPGWSLSSGLAKHLQEFVTSVVIGKDFVPRLTMKSLERLQSNIIEAGVRCKHCKARVVAETVLRGMCLPKKSWTQLQASFHPDAAPAGDGSAFMQRYRMAVAAQMGDEEYRTLHDFQVPGRILFVRDLKAGFKERTAERAYLVMSVSMEDLDNEGLLLSKRMLLDHLPDVYIDVINYALAQQRWRQARAEAVSGS